MHQFRQSVAGLLAIGPAGAVVPHGNLSQAQATARAASGLADGLLPFAIIEGESRGLFGEDSSSACLIEGTRDWVLTFGAANARRESAAFEAPAGIRSLFNYQAGVQSFRGELLTNIQSVFAGQQIIALPNQVNWSQDPNTPAVPDPLQVLAVSADGAVALGRISSHDGASRHLAPLDGRTGQARNIFGSSMGNGQITDAALSSNGRWIALIQTFRGRNELGMETNVTGQTVGQQEFTRPSYSIFTPDGQTFLVRTSRSRQDLARQVTVWSGSESRRAPDQIAAAPLPYGLALAPASNQIVITDGTTLSIWNAGTGARNLQAPLPNPVRVTATANAERVATSNGRRTIVWGPGNLDTLVPASGAVSGDSLYLVYEILSGGLGVSRDPQRAAGLLDRAAAADHHQAIDTAIARLQRDYQDGEPIQCSRVTASYQAGQRTSSRQPRRRVFSQCGLPWRRSRGRACPRSLGQALEPSHAAQSSAIPFGHRSQQDGTNPSGPRCPNTGCPA